MFTTTATRARPLDAEARPLLDRFESGPEAMAAALRRVGTEGAASLPLLDSGDQERLSGAAGRLPFRPATPVIGEGERRVLQDFELTTELGRDGPFHAVARALQALVAEGLAGMSVPPLDPPPPFDDLIVQRYPVGSIGITPHRDHITYRDLVALVTLSGRARLFLCDDRSGRGEREIPMPPGSLVLLRAPGFGGRDDRPFHLLRDVTEARISLGLRHEVPRV